MRELLAFACSPNESPLANAGNEIIQVRDAMQLGDEERVKLFFGGTLALLRQALRDCPAKRFLFAGHADLGHPDAPYGNTLAFTVPGGGGVLNTPPRPEEIADLLFEFSVANGGLLDLVVLNGCDSYELGQKVFQKGISTVVCWGTKTLDPGGRLFAKSLFQELARNETPYDSFTHAVDAVAEKYVIEGQHPLPSPGMGEAARDALTKDPSGRKQRAGVPVLLTKTGNYTVDISGAVITLPASHVFQTGPGLASAPAPAVLPAAPPSSAPAGP